MYDIALDSLYNIVEYGNPSGSDWRCRGVRSKHAISVVQHSRRRIWHRADSKLYRSVIFALFNLSWKQQGVFSPKILCE
ncbi:hypothetical protein Y032_0026g1300 [Ancylostoma ceylanicum]|uniref:Uncharacterized protein n=1 Tax=Ancylostoma ceylanicum TaxID=53326 RepID=A0A016UTB0_9BILA|nr:hypothetical protein Y032_0026g1300 [Ancylostoma ceylanicum]